MRLGKRERKALRRVMDERIAAQARGLRAPHSIPPYTLRVERCTLKDGTKGFWMKPHGPSKPRIKWGLPKSRGNKTVRTPVLPIVTL